MQVRWKKASDSGSTCVEIAHTKTMVRDSKDESVTLPCSPRAIEELLGAVKAGSFNL